MALYKILAISINQIFMIFGYTEVLTTLINAQQKIIVFNLDLKA